MQVDQSKAAASFLADKIPLLSEAAISHVRLAVFDFNQACTELGEINKVSANIMTRWGEAMQRIKSAIERERKKQRVKATIERQKPIQRIKSLKQPQRLTRQTRRKRA